jgi:hypothetical protein
VVLCKKVDLSGGFMKKIFLLSSILASTCSAFALMQSGRFEKNGIAVTYDSCLRFNSKKFGLPYCITIKNSSDKSITISPALVSVPLVPYQEVAKDIRQTYAFGVATLGGLSSIAGLMAYAITREMRDPNVVYLSGQISPAAMTEATQPGKKIVVGMHPSRLFKINIGAAGFGSFLAAYLLYKLMTEKTENLLKKEVLYEPIAIAPGKAVKKIFWLKNDKDRIHINFDSIVVN